MTVIDQQRDFDCGHRKHVYGARRAFAVDAHSP